MGDEGAMEGPIQTHLRGVQILNNPQLNKSTSFSQEERDFLGLNGLLPVHISTIDEQLKRCYQNFGKKRTPLGKYVFLTSLLNRNEHLFYQFVSRYPAEMLPYIYTPTVGEAAVQFSNITSYHRGLYLSYALEEKMEEMIGNVPQNEVDVIVVTDGERILGLGDLGIGGMTIPIGKLSLYTLFAGFHPNRTLPILLDTGTNNKELLSNDLYLGWRHPRIQGADYDRFIDRFVKAVKKRYPKVLLQWEDFGRDNARRLLDKYRSQILSFNDDIQGTASVALSGILAALKESHQNLIDQKIAILGGGSAGTGIADLIVQAMVEQGLSLEEARQRIYIVDLHGLIHFNTKGVFESQKPYMQPHNTFKDWKVVNFDHITMAEVVANAHPGVLIGVCAQPGSFTKEMVEEMARHVKRPIIFPLSNPTSKAEATPQELIEWTDAKAIIATGTPFLPVEYKGKTYKIAQCNNVYIFPGIGLGAIASGALQVTDGMFLEAAEKLATLSPALKDPTAPLFPPIEEVRKACREIAIAVAKKAHDEKVSTVPLSEIEKRVDSRMWEPAYPQFKK
ncbi:MAG: NAD-dependent malic enzyme [Verrucomicrobia bacterium]|nr:NAD-dependent malic enzyme [Verrucomicrobiota bacterium]